MNDVLVAATPQQLEVAQSKLVSWAEERVASLDEDLAEISASMDACAARGVSIAGLQRQETKLKRRRLYYENLREAFKAGYVIVPNFPITSLAIRTDRKRPSGAASSKHGTYNLSDLPQKPRPLALGEGRMFDAFPSVVDYTDGEGDEKRYHREADEFRAVSLPLDLTKPDLVEKTMDAIELKLFDEVGISPQVGCGDPMVLGRIIDHSRGFRYGTPNHLTTFFVAWWIDLATL